MTPQKANEIIYKYIGYEANYLLNGSSFTMSIDSLVPVWVKLDKHGKKIGMQLFLDGERLHRFQIWNNDYDCISTNDYEIEKYTIQEAAAIATAKAIQELTKERE